MQIREFVDKIKHEFAKFGIIGFLGFIIDVGIFNYLRFQGGEGMLYDKPLTAKVISVAVATTFSYFANRHWTFRHRQRTSFFREYGLFVILATAGMAIALGCLWISHYLLGFQSALADNLSANGAGLVLGTAFRFWSYRKWVFLAHEEDGLLAAIAISDEEHAKHSGA